MLPTIRLYAVGALLAAVAACTFPQPDLIDAGPTDAPVADAAIDAPPETDARTTATVTVIKSGNAADAGTVTADGLDCGSDCSMEVPIDSTVTLTRVVVPGVTFGGWSGVCNDTLPTCTFTVSDDVEVGAAFAISQHTITIVPAGNGTGVTTANVGGITCPGTCVATVNYNTPVRLTAMPTGTSTFAGWNDVACTGTGPCDFVVTQDVTIDARYALDFTVTVGKNGNGHGRVTAAGIDCGADCDQVYPAGSMVTLTAAADADSDFTGWNGGGCTGTQPCAVTVNGVVSVTANFTLKRYPLTIARNGTGTGTVESNPAGILCGATCSADFDHGQQVTLTATPAPSSTFVGWSEATCPGTAPCQLSLTAARSVTATFAIRTYTLTVDKAGGGVGTISSTPAGITCGTGCATTMATFTHGQSVDLTQMAGADSQFVAWGGDCSGASCTVLMTANHGVTGNFKRTDKTLTVSVAGTGAGTVVSQDGGINLPGDGSETYPHDTSVTLMATPDATTSDFAGWSGGGCGLAPSCSVRMDQAQSVVATFTLKRYTLTLSKAGVGTGTVTSDLPGINCNAACTATQTATCNHGQTVVLSQTGGTDSTFGGFSGACTGTSCSLMMTADRAVTATFARTTKTLTVTIAGNSTGTVTSVPAGINAPTDGSEAFAHGTSVDLTASWNAASTIFTGWSGGGCSGTGTVCTVAMDQAQSVTATFTLKTYTLSLTKAGAGVGAVMSDLPGINCGTTCTTTQTATYNHGQNVTLGQAAGADSMFVGYSGSCTGASCTVMMTADRAVTATFARADKTLTVALAGTGSGTVVSNDGGIMVPGDGAQTYPHDTNVILTAAPNLTSSTFAGWAGGGCSGTLATCTVRMDQAHSVTATFTLKTYTLTLTKAGAGIGAVTSMPAGINCGTTCTAGQSATFNHGQVVDLAQSVGADSTFGGWSGSCTGATCSLTMTADRTVTATFARTDKTLTVGLAGNGAGMVTSDPIGIMLPGDGTQAYAHATSVTLTATPNATTSNFGGWAGGGCSGTQLTCTVLMDQVQNVTATFTLKTYTLTLTKAGAGTGAVTSMPAGINCGTTCTTTQTATFNHGQVVDLAQSVGADSTFGGWSGSCAGATCSLTMTADRTVAATFGRTDKTLTVGLAGTGSGTVTSNPGGIMLPGDGMQTYAHGTSVVLTATPNSTTSDFGGWLGGGCSGTQLTCSVPMDQAQNVTATFTLKTYTLTFTKAGVGTGTVTSNPAGINCGTACTTTQQATFNHGQTVVLSQTVGSDSTFVAWGGDCSGASCSVVMTADRTVTASFARTDKTLTVGLAGNGAGTVTSNPAGIMLPGDGMQTYAHGTSVVLTATPNSTTSDFGGWLGGGCSGTLLTCSVPMDQAQNVTATFTLKTYTLTFTKAGVGTGTVTSNPVGISCGTACTTTQTATFNHGQTVALSQTAGPDSTFVAWGVDCSGASCSVLMTADHTVTATFARTAKTLNVSVSGTGTVTSNDGGINAPTDGTETYPHNTAVTLTAAWNNTLQSFVGWSGDGCTGTATTCPLTMDQTRNVTATFQPRTVTLTVAKNGFGTGTVASVPAGIINCGADCTEVVNAGTSVTLRATPTAGDVFYGWSGGGCTGTGDCVTTVTAATTVTATFDQCNRALAESCTDATGFYEACSTTGQATTTMTCPLGCSTTNEKCVDVDPTNGLGSYLLMTPAAPAVTLAGAWTIDTTNGVITNGTALSVPTASVNGMRVFMVSSLTITGTAKVSGSLPLVFLSNGNVLITGTLDASADMSAAGPGATSGACSGSPGDFNNPSSGGGGAGNFYGAPNGGNGGTGSAGGFGGEAFGNATITPLTGGCSGGTSQELNGSFFDQAFGGGGGGGIQIVSRTRITMQSAGKLDVSGGGGTSVPTGGGTRMAGAGGGSGGNILFEAPEVYVDGAGTVVAAKGGSGAADGNGGATHAGRDGVHMGVFNNTPAPGGTNAGYPSGGQGGINASNSAGPGGNGTTSQMDGGGGGGSVGRMRVNNTDGMFTPVNSGAVYAASSTGVMAKRFIP